MSRKPLGILFDFDGTLIASNDIKERCFFEVAAGIPGSERILRQLLDTPGIGDRNNIFRELLRQAMPGDENGPAHARLVREYTALTERAVGSAAKIPGADAALAHVGACAIPAAISSATPQRTLEKLIGAQGLSCHFLAVYGSPEEKVGHIARFAERLSCAAERLLYVGDSEIDRASALRMGCCFIGIGRDTRRFDTPPGTLLPDLRGFQVALAGLA